MTPVVIIATPIQFVAGSYSLRKATPKMATSTTLSLSTGATRDAIAELERPKNSKAKTAFFRADWAPSLAGSLTFKVRRKFR